jgi:type I restriction enzyme M protein
MLRQFPSASSNGAPPRKVRRGRKSPKVLPMDYESPARALQDISTDFATIPAGKLRCYITGKLRLDTPEEHVRQRVARSLVEEYGYAKSDLALEYTIQLGRAKKKADIVIFSTRAPHKVENINIIVEAKRESVKPSHADQGTAQLHSYLSASPNSRFGMWVGSEIVSFEKAIDRGRISYLEALDIPFADGKSPAAEAFSSLVPATDVLKDVFRRCHNYISTNQGGSKEFAFAEFLKVTFCKVFDERFSSSPHFYIKPHERRSATGQAAALERLKKLYTSVCEQYGYIFGEDDKLNLKGGVAAYILGELQKYSLRDTDIDYKGQAYEEIVGANSRGERGEFFTPRNLCKLAVDLLFDVAGDKRLASMRVLDPACGTGGFLRTYVHEMGERLYRAELLKWGDAGKARQSAAELLKQLCDRNVYGIDFNPVLVRAAQMNLVMHGDGSSNIFHENSLLQSGEWADATRERIKDAHFDVVLTNPPFGEDLSVDDPHVLDQYELPRFMAGTTRSSMAPQELFLERCHRLLKPEGLLAIVSPDNLLSNPGYDFFRVWLLLRFQLIASVWLPGEMFQPSTGTQTSLLLLRKRRKPLSKLADLASEERARPVFFAVPKRIGHDQRGSFIPLRDEDGNVVVRKRLARRYLRDPSGKWVEELLEISEDVPNDHLPRVAEEFRAWLARVRG